MNTLPIHLLAAVTTLGMAIQASAQSTAGDSDCPCISESPLKNTIFNVEKAGVKTVRAQVTNKKFYYAEDYGTSCKDWDASLPPHCGQWSATTHW